MDPIIAAIILFVLALVIGFEVITKVPPILHTPLVVASHAMASIMVVSAIEVTGTATTILTTVLAVIALVMGTVNVVGGYFIADRMLAMFKSDKKKKQ
ncbi:MAG: NAD(P) transhydrogenase subunit alpha [Spirochaetia bacterium]|nr:NAD(P) transhydrogenase subunit alpha [Spirochaetota bacterium]MCX8096924.1 NAD(P) transhydrogenase subunit alpha [Spirochaetota bacterium]MDW8112435.1 NAD(P) transhydrogenase subunit alpha [Spirochaetia bacterium]